jgi:hypothetical protein
MSAALLQNLNGGVVLRYVVEGGHEHAKKEQEEECRESDCYDPGRGRGVKLFLPFSHENGPRNQDEPSIQRPIEQKLYEEFVVRL